MSKVHTETERLNALSALQIMRSERLPEYDAVVETLASIFDCPISLVSLVGEDEQWFKAKCGLEVDGTPRDISFCQHAILSDDLFVISDAKADERFKDNPLVTGEPNIRFYAGCPLSIDGKNRLGTLCVIDREPRTPTEMQLTQLRRLGTVVEGLMRAHDAQTEAQKAIQVAESEHRNAIRESDLLEEIASVSGVGGWELDIAASELTWTDKTREIHEVSPDYSPSVSRALSYYAPESREIIAKAVKDGIEHGTGWDKELPFITAKGRNIWVRAAGRPITEDGEVTRLVGAFQDITARKQSEETIRHSEAVHRTTLETLREGILLLDRSGKILSFNSAATKLLGSELEDLGGKNVQDLRINCYTEDGEVDAGLLLRAAEKPEIVNNFIAKVVQSDGSQAIWLRIDANATDNSDGPAFDEVVVSLADISETKRQAETLQVVMNNMPGGLVYYDENRRLSVCNEEYRQLLDVPQELVDRQPHMREVFTFLAKRGDYGPGDPEQYIRKRLEYFDDPTPHAYERKTPDGRTIEVRGFPLANGGLVANFFDISERKRIELSVRQSEAVHRTTLDSLSEGILLLTHSGEIQSANPAATELLGIDSNTLVGSNVRDHDFGISYEIHGLGSSNSLLEVAAHDPYSVTDIVAQINPAGGSRNRWLRVNAKPIDEDHEFDLDGVVVSMADITDSKEQADTLQALFDNFPGGFAHYDETFQLASSNAEFSRVLNYPQDLIDQKLHLLDYLKFNAERGDYGEGDPEALALDIFKTFTKYETQTYERSAADGSYIEVRSTPLPQGGAIYNFFDVTERKQMEARLAESERIARNYSSELEAILANMRQGVSVFDKDGRLSLWNQQYIDIFGKPDGEVQKGKSLIELIQAEKDRGEFDGDVQEHVMDLMVRMTSGEVVRSKFPHPNGKVILAVHAPMPGGGWIGTHEDVTLREQAAAKIAYAATHDSLTGLANRMQFNAALEESLDDARVHQTNGCLLLLDLDKFKPVNDTYGHDVGDELLKQASQRMKDCVRSADLVARLGGDEFGIILRGTGHGNTVATEVAERILAKLQAPFVAFAHRINIGVSIGIASINEDSSETSTIIKNADIALYQVKNTGRNDFRYFEETAKPRAVQG
ncbi:putative diguanylate cyclase AdrA [Roseibium album]|nr:putative diguanylate cyclase AdrA [Roseibium album]